MKKGGLRVLVLILTTTLDGVPSSTLTVLVSQSNLLNVCFNRETVLNREIHIQGLCLQYGNLQWDCYCFRCVIFLYTVWTNLSITHLPKMLRNIETITFVFYKRTSRNLWKIKWQFVLNIPTLLSHNCVYHIIYLNLKNSRRVSK